MPSAAEKAAICFSIIIFLSRCEDFPHCSASKKMMASPSERLPKTSPCFPLGRLPHRDFSGFFSQAGQSQATPSLPGVTRFRGPQRGHSCLVISIPWVWEQKKKRDNHRDTEPRQDGGSGSPNGAINAGQRWWHLLFPRLEARQQIPPRSSPLSAHSDTESSYMEETRVRFGWSDKVLQ